VQTSGYFGVKRGKLSFCGLPNYFGDITCIM
jgi:hypothetical protein